MNIVKFLKNCPRGTKLYSPIFGYGILDRVLENEITIEFYDDPDGLIRTFDEYGRYIRTNKAAVECVIFPSKTNRDWNNMIEDEWELYKVKRWKDDKYALISGYPASTHGIYKKIDEIIQGNAPYLFATETQAKSALAMTRISQIMANDKRFGGTITDEEWNDSYSLKYCIARRNNDIMTQTYFSKYEFLAFHTEEQRDLFLKENRDLVEDYLMIPEA